MVGEEGAEVGDEEGEEDGEKEGEEEGAELVSQSFLIRSRPFGMGGIPHRPRSTHPTSIARADFIGRQG